MLGVQKGSLSLAEKRESSLIHCCRANRPSVTDVYLLSPFVCQITKARNVSTTCLKTGEWFRQIVILEIVVTREPLVLCELLVD